MNRHLTLPLPQKILFNTGDNISSEKDEFNPQKKKCYNIILYIL